MQDLHALLDQKLQKLAGSFSSFHYYFKALSQKEKEEIWLELFAQAKEIEELRQKLTT